jgi:hypothetical protein
LPKHLHRLTGGTDARERLEEVVDGFPDLRVGVEYDVAGLVIDQARGQRTPILAAPHLVEDAAAQSGFEDVQLGLTHRAFETEQEPIVEARRIVDTILIEDQGIGERADLQQAMPVRVVPGQTRHLQAHHDARVPHAHVRNQTLKALAPGRRRARLALILIDDGDLIVAPAECDGAATQGVLPFGALDVLDDLTHR